MTTQILCDVKIGKTENSAFRDIKRRYRGHHCSYLQNLPIVESSIFRRSAIPRITFAHRPGLSRRNAGRTSTFALSGYVCVFATHRRRRRHDPVLSRETRRRRYERKAWSQTLQPEVTTSSLLG